MKDNQDCSVHSPAQISDVEKIARIFSDYSGDFTIVPEGQGNINDTYIVDTAGKKIILQRISVHVFPDPQIVAENFGRISNYLTLKLLNKNKSFHPEAIPTLDGKNFFKDGDGQVWRAQKYIENTKTYHKLVLPERANQVGQCLAGFHNLVKDMSPLQLEVALPGFHNLPLYLKKYDEAVKRYCKKIPEKLQYCLDFVEDNRINENILEGLKEKGEISMSVTHGDPKVSNVLFDRDSDKALTLIDFDTVGPGLLLYDIGDCLRSCCCSIDENEYGKAPVRCELEMVEAVLQGYYSKNDISPCERNHIFESLYLVTFELGLRFLTDYLQADRYFKICHKHQNLHRALVQFELVTSICQQRQDIQKIAEQSWVKALKTGRK